MPNEEVTNVWLILVRASASSQWMRVGPPYRTRFAAEDWREFVKAAKRGCAVKIKHESIPRKPGKARDRVEKRFLDEYQLIIKKRA